MANEMEIEKTVSVNFGSLALHVACGLGALKAYVKGDSAAIDSLEYVKEELFKLYQTQVKAAAPEPDANRQPDEERGFGILQGYHSGNIPRDPETAYARQVRIAKEDISLMGGILPHEQIAHAKKREAYIADLESRLNRKAKQRDEKPLISDKMFDDWKQTTIEVAEILGDRELIQEAHALPESTQPDDRPVYRGRDHTLHLTKKAKDFLQNAHARKAEQPNDWGAFIGKIIHYPECWDTAAYPTVYDAINEMAACVSCSECKYPGKDPEADQRPTVRESVTRAEWEGYINGVEAIINCRPPSSTTHDGANTLNELRAIGDVKIGMANDELAEIRRRGTVDDAVG